MRQKPGQRRTTAEHIVGDIRRRTRKHHSAEEKITIVLEGLRRAESIAGRNFAMTLYAQSFLWFVSHRVSGTAFNQGR